MACTFRSKSTDAVDVMRMLEVCRRAQVHVTELVPSEQQVVRRVLSDQFGRNGQAAKAIVDSALPLGGAVERETRLQALVANFLRDAPTVD